METTVTKYSETGWSKCKPRKEDPDNSMYVDFNEEIVVAKFPMNYKRNKKEYIPATVIASYHDRMFGLIRVVKSKNSFYCSKKERYIDMVDHVNYQGCTCSMGQKIVYNKRKLND